MVYVLKFLTLDYVPFCSDFVLVAFISQNNGGTANSVDPDQTAPSAVV